MKVRKIFTKKFLSLFLVFTLLTLLSYNVKVFADMGASNYRIVHEETNFLGVVRVTVSNVHSNYMGPIHGTRDHINVNVYVSGVEVANFHVWKSGTCIYVFESKTSNTTKYCGSNTKTAVEKAFEQQTQSPSLTAGISQNIPWWAVGVTVVGIVLFAATVLLAAPGAAVFLAI